MAYFEIIGEVQEETTIASGAGVRRAQTLRKRYGGVRWRKLKGIAQIRDESGKIRTAELHWYEAHGVGKRGFKIKRFLD